MQISQLEAAPNCAIIERIEEEEVLASGIILLCNAKSRDPIAKGVVHSIGLCTDKSGNVIEADFKVGDRVLYRRNAFIINIPNDTKKYFSVPVGRVEVVLEV